LLEATMTDKREPDRNSTDGRIERAKDAALGAHLGEPTIADEMGEAAGGISGVLVGAGIGSAAGPVGTLIGGIAGAIGGWWAGRAVTEAAGALSREDDEYFRSHYDAQPNRLADRAYDDVRPAYYLGHIASFNPAFDSLEFIEFEPQLAEGWSPYADHHGSWSSVRNYAAEGFARGRSWVEDAARRDDGRVKGELDERRR
jgi:hypothetical protein